MLVSFALIVLLMIFPQEAAAGAVKGLRMCATAVIPSLFPFFVATRLLPQIRCRRLSRLLRLPEGVASALFVSFVGGYPIGVARICAMYENAELQKHEAQQAIVFCNNSGPGFFVGMIGAYALGDSKLGLLLFSFHVASALICAYLFRTQSKNYCLKRLVITQKSFAERFSEAISASCEAMLSVSALVVLFSILLSIVTSSGLLSALPAWLKALIFGSLELTSGIALAKGEFVVCAFLMGWGGVCVHLQAMSLWKKHGLTVRNYLLSKLMHGLISALFAAAYLRGAVIFTSTVLVFIIVCILLRNFLKFGVEKRRKMLYNSPVR